MNGLRYRRLNRFSISRIFCIPHIDKEMGSGAYSV